MHIQSKKGPRAYVTITDPVSKKSVSVTVSGATRDEVASRLRQLFGEPPKISTAKPVAA